MDDKCEPQLRVMETSFDVGDERDTDGIVVVLQPTVGYTNFQPLGKLSATVAALALTFARACGNDSNSDDILLIANRHLINGIMMILGFPAYDRPLR